MEKQDLKFTDLDYLIADHHLQMIKAALPYVTVSQQKFFSLLVKSSELMRTAQLFQDDGQGEMGICSIEQEHQSPIEMMNAMKPYGTPQEQDMMDVIINIMQGFQIRRNYQETVSPQETVPPQERPSPALMMEKLKSILSPEQQARFENLQLMLQAMQAFA